MPKNSVAEWDETAGNNTDVGGVDIDEGCAPSGINNAIRTVMAQIKTYTGVAPTYVSTDAGAGVGPVLTLYRNSASPAASDLLGEVLFTGEDASGATQDYAAIVARITDTTAGNEDGDLLLQSEVAGVLTTGVTVRNGGILGTQTNDNAAAGNIGQTISASVASGSAVSLTSSIPANITSLELTAGDWLVWGSPLFVLGASTSLSIIAGGINTTSATLPATPSQLWVDRFTAFVPGNVGMGGYTVGPTRFSVTSNTTIYLIGQATFTISTAAAYGAIYALRIR